MKFLYATKRTCRKMGIVQRTNLKNGKTGNAFDLRKRCDEMETSKPASSIPQRPTIKPRRITQVDINTFREQKPHRRDRIILGFGHKRSTTRIVDYQLKRR